MSHKAKKIYNISKKNFFKMREVLDLGINRVFSFHCSCGKFKKKVTVIMKSRFSYAILPVKPVFPVFHTNLPVFAVFACIADVCRYFHIYLPILACFREVDLPWDVSKQNILFLFFWPYLMNPFRIVNNYRYRYFSSKFENSQNHRF